MSTRVSRPKGHLLYNVVYLGLAASIVAGCSGGSDRFDNLFTASAATPQRLDGPQNFLPKADLAGAAAQRLGGSLSGGQNQGLFNAKNITSQARLGGFNQSQLPTQLNNQSQQFGAPTLSGSRQLARSPSISRQSLPPAQSLPQNASFQTPQNQSAIPSSGRLSLDQARQLNNSSTSKPLLARQPQQQALLQSPVATSAPAQQFSHGTAWTQEYSPVPTSSPASRPSSSSLSAGPRGYTPPRSSVDTLSTSSIRSSGGPKIISSTVARPASQRAATRTQVDPVNVASVGNANANSSAKGGWSATGGTYVTLQQGETLYSLSRRYGVPVKAIANANNISNTTQVRSGQQILIPTYVYSPNAPISSGAVNKRQASHAPVTIKSNNNNALKQPLPKKTAQGASYNGVYQVQKGDTLTRIAANHNMSVASLRNANGLHTSDVIQIGQKLKVVSGESVSPVAGLPRLDNTTTASVTSYAPNAATTEPRSKPIITQRVDISKSSVIQARPPKVRPSHQAKVVTAKINNPKPVKATTQPKIDKITTASNKAVANSGFIWPVRGEVIKRFSEKSAGINLNVPVGTPVRASASGEVIYASNGLADYGNLVLIRHSNGFVTAYAHNSQLLVRRGDRVRQGQVVAKSGQSGAVKSPQLHFELREGKKPVDPLNHLSG
ncbi:MAG: peptidoglycan DD-metalloendopeptidase family protein [Hyphomicrobiales bacterium]